MSESIEPERTARIEPEQRCSRKTAMPSLPSNAFIEQHG
jgi:hypothetical protein